MKSLDYIVEVLKVTKPHLRPSVARRLAIEAGNVNLAGDAIAAFAALQPARQPTEAELRTAKRLASEVAS